MSGLSVGIAGIVFHLQFPSIEWQLLIRQQYTDFLTDAPAVWQVDIQCDPTLTLVRPGWVQNQAEITTFRLLSYRGHVDFQHRHAAIAAPSIENALSAVDRVLAYILMHVLPASQNALLLHGVGLTIHGQGHVFFGPSGAGKTTIATLAAGQGELFNDENVVLSFNHSLPQLHSTPFWGHSTPAYLIRRSQRQAPLRALYGLRHGPDFHLEQLSSAESVIALLLTEKIAADRAENMIPWLSVVEAILAVVPVYTLTFRPTNELWPFLCREGLCD